MFGESESESPRVPSPWDVVLSSSAPLDRVHNHQEEPKLAAEVEEVCSASYLPERFTCNLRAPGERRVQTSPDQPLSHPLCPPRHPNEMEASRRRRTGYIRVGRRGFRCPRRPHAQRPQCDAQYAPRYGSRDRRTRHHSEGDRSRRVVGFFARGSRLRFTAS